MTHEVAPTGDGNPSARLPIEGLIPVSSAGQASQLVPALKVAPVHAIVECLLIYDGGMHEILLVPPQLHHEQLQAALEKHPNGIPTRGFARLEGSSCLVETPWAT